MRTVFRSLIGAATAIVITIGLGAGAAGAAPAQTCRWSSLPSPSPGSAAYLEGVAATSAGDVWAVGTTSDVGYVHTLVEHWNGLAWVEVASPSPGTSQNDLHAVAAISPADAWAVGIQQGGGNPQTLVEHWDGSAWSVVTSPNPGSNGNQLQSVTALAPGDVWAVGVSLDQSSSSKTLVEHWNGSSWSAVASRSPGSGINKLAGAAAGAGAGVWAVGATQGSAATLPLAEHWDGTSWSVAASASPGSAPDNEFEAVALTSATDAWAVGFAGGPTTGTTTVIERWDGTTWKLVASPTPGSPSSGLYGVAAMSTSDAWAVGLGDPGGLIEHWNGTAWSTVPAGTADASARLLGVAAISASNVWAVGNSGSTQTGFRSLIERYGCVAAATQPAGLAPTGGGDQRAAGVAAMALLAVGLALLTAAAVVQRRD